SPMTSLPRPDSTPPCGPTNWSTPPIDQRRLERRSLPDARLVGRHGAGMTDVPSEPTHRPPRRGNGGLASAILKWLEPEDNPSGVIYGTIAVGAVLAAESTRRETFADTLEATVIILGL